MKKCIGRLRVLVNRLKAAYSVVRKGSPDLAFVFTVGMMCGGLLAATLDAEARSKLEELARKLTEGLRGVDVKAK